MNAGRNCKQREQAIAAFVIGELDAPAAAELAEHIEHCGHCRRLRDALATEEKMIRSAFDTVAARAEAMADRLAEGFEERPHEANSQPPTPDRERREPRYMKRILTIAAAVVLIIAGASIVNLLTPDTTRSGMALAEVIARFAEVQSLHLSLNMKGRVAEAWVRRPNQLRIEYEDGTYEISDGPTLWVVNPAAGKATKKDSFYYHDAQERGIEVLDLLAELPYTDDFSGFFSEEPQEQIRREGSLFDVYRMDVEAHGTQFRSEALVDVQTDFLHSIKVDRQQEGQWRTLIAFTVLAYDVDIPDERFEFAPAEGMKVVVEQSKKPEAQPADISGSTLSGRITWAETGKPVGGARVWCSGGERIMLPEGGSRRSFWVRAETNRDGVWQVKGAPAGPVQISVRSWELNWPAVPVFEANAGSSKSPTVLVDGQTEHGGLDFEVYKPQNVFARITMNVTDEDGHPVEGAGAYLSQNGSNVQHVYAARGQQRTGKDGRMDARDIWPTKNALRVVVNHYADDTPYVYRGLQSEPFVVESGQSYHFDMVLPFPRRMTVKVVDPDGQPLVGVAVAAIDPTTGHPFFPRCWEQNTTPLLTDAEGLATLESLKPGEIVLVALRRLKTDSPDRPEGPCVPSATASACVRVAVPKGRETSLQTVAFDERPIRIEGTSDLPEGSELKSLYCMVVEGAVMSFLSADLGDSGAFVLEGVPAGDIYIVYAYDANQSGNYTRGDATLHTEPGNTYKVRITPSGLELLPSPER